MQEFYDVSQSDYLSVLDEIDGISRSRHDAKAKAIFQHYSKTCHIMCNATSLTPKEDEQDGYQFYTRVFVAGDVAPSFSPEAEEHTTISIQSINRQVTYKFCSARRFYEFIPLSLCWHC